MAAITLEKTWVSSVKAVDPLVYTTLDLKFSQLIYLYKVALVEAGWVVVRSCDSSAVAASDLWSDRSKVVYSAAGVHSWIVLRNAAISPTFDLCLYYKTNNNYQLGIAFCFDGFQASGSTTAHPDVNTGGVILDYGLGVLSMSNVSGGLGLVCLHSTDHQSTRVFFSAAGRHTFGTVESYCSAFMMVEVPKNPADAWQRKFVVAFVPGLVASIHGGFNNYFISYGTRATSNGIPFYGEHLGVKFQARLGAMCRANTAASSFVTQNIESVFDMSGAAMLCPFYVVSDSFGFSGVLGSLYDAYSTPSGNTGSLITCGMENHFYTLGSDRRALFAVGHGAFGSDGARVRLP